MESHTFIDTVKLEKANAIAKYRRFRKLAKLVQVIEFIVAFTLISWSSTCLPAVLKHSVGYLLQFSHYILNTHVVFLIGNAIVIALFILYRHIDAASNSSNKDIVNEEDYLEINGDNHQIITTTVTVTEEEKRIVCEEEEEINAIEAVEHVTKAIDEATKRLQKFQRTQSHKLKRPKIKELRRSETDVGRVVVSSPHDQPTTPYQAVDKLSNDEFRMAIEAFIQKQQKFLRQQKLAENISNY